MDATLQRLIKILGATSVETYGHDTRFVVEGKAGGRLHVNVEAASQRVMAVLKDGQGVTRCTVDLAPVHHVLESKEFPHRITLRVGRNLAVHLDSDPSLAIELVTEDGD